MREGEKKDGKKVHFQVMRTVLPQAEVPEIPYVPDASHGIEALALVSVDPGSAGGQELECFNVCMCTRYYLHKTSLYVWNTNFQL